jgi:hypothetical protein
MLAGLACLSGAGPASPQACRLRGPLAGVLDADAALQKRGTGEAEASVGHAQGLTIPGGRGPGPGQLRYLLTGPEDHRTRQALYRFSMRATSSEWSEVKWGEGQAGPGATRFPERGHGLTRRSVPRHGIPRGLCSARPSLGAWRCATASSSESYRTV